MSEYLSELNDEQRRAVETVDGPLLVIAGAGTGKTRTLTYRILHLIKAGVSPTQILAVTFTNKAAKEMRERVETLLYPQGDVAPYAPTPMLKTFHSLGVYILRRHYRELGVNKYFTILDRQDAIAMIKRGMKNLDISPKEWDPKRLLSIISKSKGAGQNAAIFASQTGSELTDITSKVWTEYERLKTAEQAFDFDDLLLKTYELLRDNEDILGQYQKLWKYVHVDEYQDTNGIQQKLIELLVATHKNLCVVGDGDQTIYTWRGASMSNILNFEKNFPGAKVVILDQNYRSTATILHAAQHIIEKNTARVDKALHPTHATGEPITVFQALNANDEAGWILSQIQKILGQDISPSNIAILFRTNFQSRVLEEAFLQTDIPYHVAGVRFFERKEVKDALAYLRAALNRESLSDLGRVINYPKRALGKVSVAKIFAGQLGELPKKALESYTNFVTILDEIQNFAFEHPPSETVNFILERSGIKAELEKGGADDYERLENLHELVSYATKYDVLQLAQEEAPSDPATPDHLPPGSSPGQALLGEVTYVVESEKLAGDFMPHLEKMLEHISLMSDQDELGREDKIATASVKLMTIHAAKGLEFDHVFITGLEQGLFPSEVEGNGDNQRDPEEERRLMYVAVTRAKKKLHLSYAQTRTIYGSTSFQMPSEFLFDIPEKLLQYEGGSETLTEYGEDEDGEVKTVYLDF